MGCKGQFKHIGVWRSWLAYHAGRDGRPAKGGITPTIIRGAEFSAPYVFNIKMVITYILYSSRINKFYTGQTDDLERRLEEHNRGKTPFMANGIPWKLVYSKTLSSREDAMILEKFIKKRGAARFLKDNDTAVG
jgi:putative endonuclease